MQLLIGVDVGSSGCKVRAVTPRVRSLPAACIRECHPLAGRKEHLVPRVDCSGFEKRDEPRQPNHEILFSHDIPLIKHLAHLEKLQSTRFFMVAVPWRVHGLEASPASVVAFEKEADDRGGAPT